VINELKISDTQRKEEKKQKKKEREQKLQLG
jgi:hypothetical protein